MKRRRRVRFEESWNLVTGNLPDSSGFSEYVVVVPAMAVWWWITGVPDAYSPAVTQAAGMVSVQASCSLQQALALLRERADKDGKSIEEIAGGVIDRRIGFDE